MSKTKINRSQNTERTPYNIAAILRLGLIIFDLIMDVLFASKKAPEVGWLYIPNTIILILSLTINFILALYIINFEKSSNAEFTKWLNTHKTVLSIFALLSSADIEALNILQSFDFFKLEFSYNATGIIFWGACLDIFIEDLPQVIIQILYFRAVTYYDIISLLALASSCLTLTVHIIGRFYQGVNPKFTGRPKVPAEDPKRSHPLQIYNPVYDNNGREIRSSSDQEKIRDGGKGKLPEVVIDSQNTDNEESSDQSKSNKRSSVSSFKEMIH